MPKITAQLLKEKCDKLSVKICAAVQFFQVPGTFGVEQLSLDWGNFLTLQEYRSTRKQGIYKYIYIYIYIYMFF